MYTMSLIRNPDQHLELKTQVLYSILQAFDSEPFTFVLKGTFLRLRRHRFGDAVIHTNSGHAEVGM